MGIVVALCVGSFIFGAQIMFMLMVAVERGHLNRNYWAMLRSWWRYGREGK